MKRKGMIFVEREINKKDVILGLIMLSLSGYILFGSNVIVGDSILKESILVGRADFYIKFLAIIMILISAALILKAFGVFGLKNKETSDEPTNNVAKLSFVALIIYGFILKPMGFFASSFLLIMFLSFIIRIKEDGIDLKDKKLVIKSLVISCAFSIITVSIFAYIFTNWLKVVLP